jgi:DNA polymerase-4
MEDQKPFQKRSFPRAIMHLDGDAFFAGVEIAKNPALRGKPVVTGEERGIATAISYEAKRMYGITRAMPIHEIRKKFPEVIIVKSDYESYALYSQRMKDIVRRVTDLIEDSSIDECFADLTGQRRYLHTDYQGIIARIQKEIDDELGVSVSIGVAPTKVLAKLASKWAKPHGLTLIPGPLIHTFLEKTPISGVWGIGPQTSGYLSGRGVRTALDLARRDESWVMSMLTKPHQEIWRELRGESVYQLAVGEAPAQKSISKTETFVPPSRNRAFVYAELSRNIERAAKKARSHRLAARHVTFFLKTQGFLYHSADYALTTATNDAFSILALAQEAFDRLYRPGVLYRATGVTLSGLVDDTILQEDLFGALKKEDGHKAVFRTLDRLESEMGKGTVFVASSFSSVLRHKAERKKEQLVRDLLAPQRFFGLPVLGEVN